MALVPNLLVPVLHQPDQALEFGGTGANEVPLQLRKAGRELAGIAVAADEVLVDLGIRLTARPQLACTVGNGWSHSVSPREPMWASLQSWSERPLVSHVYG